MDKNIPHLADHGERAKRFQQALEEAGRTLKEGADSGRMSDVVFSGAVSRQRPFVALYEDAVLMDLLLKSRDARELATSDALVPPHIAPEYLYAVAEEYQRRHTKSV